jgi:hypothetical protein
MRLARMTPIAAAVGVQRPNDQSAALRHVGERLLAIANDESVNWTDLGRMNARRAAIEMLQQAASVEMKDVGCLRP